MTYIDSFLLGPRIGDLVGAGGDINFPMDLRTNFFVIMGKKTL